MSDEHIPLDPFYCSHESHSKHNLEHAQLPENYMARGPNVLETCEPSRSAEDQGSEPTGFGFGKRQLTQIVESESPNG